MSALLAHAKAFRALSRCLHRAASERRENGITPLAGNAHFASALTLGSMAQAYEWAADDLEQQARDEAMEPDDVQDQRRRRYGPGKGVEA